MTIRNGIDGNDDGDVIDTDNDNFSHVLEPKLLGPTGIFPLSQGFFFGSISGNLINLGCPIPPRSLIHNLYCM